MGVPALTGAMPPKWEVMHPDAVARYKEFLREQKDQGVIAGETYSARMSAFDELRAHEVRGQG